MLFCKQSFMSLWSYASPEGKTHGREMCDILVVCDPDIIILSVKDVRPTKHADDAVRAERWVRAAVNESVDQVYGAERFIQTDKHTHVRQEDGTDGLPYPTKDTRRIHRVAVALGGNGHFPLPFGDFGKGFVHVFDERSFSILTANLDTIADFVDYLRAKEEMFSKKADVRFALEEDILAITRRTCSRRRSRRPSIRSRTATAGFAATPVTFTCNDALSGVTSMEIDHSRTPIFSSLKKTPGRNFRRSRRCRREGCGRSELRLG